MRTGTDREEEHGRKCEPPVLHVHDTSSRLGVVAGSNGSMPILNVDKMSRNLAEEDRIEGNERIDAKTDRFISPGTMEEADLVMNVMEITTTELTAMVHALKVKGGVD